MSNPYSGQEIGHPGISPLDEPEPEQESLALCFRCVTGTCGHRDQLPSPHSGTIPLHGVPAITAHRGTPLCLDCAMAARSQ